MKIDISKKQEKNIVNDYNARVISTAAILDKYNISRHTLNKIKHKYKCISRRPSHKDVAYQNFDKKPGIYCIQNNITAEKYVGCTNNIRKRVYYHCHCLSKGNHKNSHLQGAWNRYGADNFTFFVIKYCEKNILNQSEIFWINVFDTYNNGYNQCEGGGVTRGYKYSEEQKQVLREQSRKLWINNPLNGKDLGGENNGFYGQKHSPETISKISKENHYNAKINQKQVNIIRWLGKNSDMSQREIAEIFDISRGHVGSIKRGKKWKTV